MPGVKDRGEDAASEALALAERGRLAHEAFLLVLAGAHHDEAVTRALRAWDGGALLDYDATGGSTLQLVCGVLVWCDELERALAILDAAAERAQADGSVGEYASAMYARSWPYFYAGRVADAVESVRDALDAGPHVCMSYLPIARRVLVSALLERNDLAAAKAAVDAPDAENRWGRGVNEPRVLFARAEIAVAERRLEDALSLLLEAGRLLVRVLQTPTPVVLPWRSSAAVVAARLGDSVLARSLAEEELELARRTAVPRAIGMALRAFGVVVGGDEGIEHLRAAVDLLASSPSSLEHARALVDLGAMLRAAGERVPARDPLRAALDIAHRGGAVALASRASSELVATGARPRRPMLSGVDALTASERRVAQLAAQSMTNRQIAEAVFVSQKTVETHLRNVFQKLRISSRKELPAALAGDEPGAPS